MQDSKVNEFSSEVARIEHVYAQRRTNVPAHRYSQFNDGQLFMIQEVEQNLLRALKERGYLDLRDITILDVGCGSGFWLGRLISWGAAPRNLYGVDLVSERIELARESLPTQVTLDQGSATELKFPDQYFGLVLQFTAFSSVLSCKMRQQVAREMLRVLKPDGYIVWYDFHINNPNNGDVRAVNKKEVRDLFRGCRCEFRRLTLAAPLVRALAPFSPLLCEMLAACKILSTHYLAFIQKGES